MSKIIVPVSLNKTGINEVRLPKGTMILGVAASQHGHQLFLNTIQPLKRTNEEQVFHVAVAPEKMVLEISENVQYLGCAWAQDVINHVFLVMPKQQEDVDQGPDSTEMDPSIRGLDEVNKTL